MENRNVIFYPKTNPLENIAILIPAFNPDDKLIFLINELIDTGVRDIIIVNDGSKDECKDIFYEIKNFSQCVVLNHAVNLGKGRSLKTGFNYFLNHYKGYAGIITVDADGQHNCTDIINVAKALKENPYSLILGTRNFDNSNIPFRSKAGNLITRKIFSFFAGINLSDTQTGLRGIPYNHLLSMVKIGGERYEFEMNILMECSQQKIDIKEVPIETIYIDENKSSHFNPLLDSLKIYFVFFKFIASSLASFLVDIISFILFVKLFKFLAPSYFILAATIGSRVLSSAFNYVINYKTVFSFKGSKKNSAVKYYILSVIQMLISAVGVSLIYKQFHQGEVIIKMLVDSALFLGSYTVQRDWVFRLKK